MSGEQKSKRCDRECRARGGCHMECEGLKAMCARRGQISAGDARCRNWVCTTWIGGYPEACWPGAAQAKTPTGKKAAANKIIQVTRRGRKGNSLLARIKGAPI
jgi:hypothetical protein